MIAGYTALAQKLFISYLRDMLRPHRLNRFSVGLHKHTCNGGKVYYHERNRFDKIAAEKFFTEHNKDFQFWCNLMEWDAAEILKIVDYCVQNNKDRLYGKNALKAYFTTKKEG